MTESRPQAEENLRRCALTGGVAPPSDLLCFVVDPVGRVIFDLKQNLPVEKRVWLLPHRHVIEQARLSGVFARLDANAACPENLADQVYDQLLARLQEQLHLLRRSGAVVGGFEKVRKLLGQGRAVLLVQACDAAEDGREKLAKLAGHHHIPVITLFPRRVLAAVTGQENQTHLAILPHGLADKLKLGSARLLAFDAPEAV